MAIAYKSAGAGVATEASGGALSPLCPATVDAGDILIAHTGWEGTSTAPSTPNGWTLLGGPYTIESAHRHWVFGKIADGTEDGAAVAFGSPAVTTVRTARVYSFSGRVSGTITDLVPAASFAHISHATDPQMPTVTTTIAGGLAVACIWQADDNAQASATGATGGTWAEAVAEYVQLNTTPDTGMGLQTCTPTANPGTVTGGSVATANDPCGVIAFEVRPSVPATVLVIQDGGHGHTGDNLALTQHNVLTVQDAAHAHAGDNVALTQHNVLVVQDAAHAHVGDNLTLTAHEPSTVLVIQDGSHSHTADNLVLTQHNVLAIADAAHTHLADNLALVQHNILAIQDASHAHAAEAPALVQHNILAIQDTAHGHAGESPALIQHNVLAIQDAGHTNAAESLTLVQHNVLVIQDGHHAHKASNLWLEYYGESPAPAPAAPVSHHSGNYASGGTSRTVRASGPAKTKTTAKASKPKSRSQRQKQNEEWVMMLG